MGGALLALAASARSTYSIAIHGRPSVLEGVVRALVGFGGKPGLRVPEEVGRVGGPDHSGCVTELVRHGGHGESFSGDPVTALFGAPAAHEDDPERAIRAAPPIREFAVEEGL